MAIQTSEHFLRKLKPPHLLHLHALIVLHKPLRFVRRILAEVFKPSPVSVQLPEVVITDNFEQAAHHFQERGWAYVDQPFHPDFYSALITHWPSNFFFKPPETITKGYNIGFHWRQGTKEPPYINNFPVLKHLFTFLHSPEWAERFRAFSGSPHPLVCNSFIVNTSYPGSSVIPHKDSPLPKEATPYINIVFFINGTGGTNSGALTLSHDNKMKDVVFEPPSVRNSCLIYDTDTDVFHGFEPIAWGKFRWAITSNFCRKGYVPPEHKH